MGTISIELDTYDGRLAFHIFGYPKSIKPGSTIVILEADASLRIEGMPMAKAEGIPEVLQLALSFGSSVVASVIANWLYEKLKKNDETVLRIEECQVDINKGEIERIITRVIEEKRL